MERDAADREVPDPVQRKAGRARQQIRRDESAQVRRNELTSGGTVLPSAWNMLELTNTMPDGMKFQATMRRYSAPTASTPGSSLNTLNQRFGRDAADHEQHHHRDGAISRRPERRAHAIGQARAEVLAGDRADREAERDHRHEAGLDHPQPDAEARLRRGAEPARDRVDRRTCRRPSARTPRPPAARSPACAPTARSAAATRAARTAGSRARARHSMISATTPGDDRDERRDRGARHAQRMARHPAEHQRRREHDVQHHRRRLDRTSPA